VALVFALVAYRFFQLWAAPERDMTFGGVHRSYRVHVGGGARAGRPLVLVLHGVNGSSEAIERRTRRSFDRLADRDGAVIVYPDPLGAPSRWSGGASMVYRLACDRPGLIAAIAPVSDAATYVLLDSQGQLELAHYGDRLTLTGGTVAERAIPPAPEREPPKQPPGRQPSRQSPER
jgi:poly(3-hydroxybutyrate) depolymerase